MDAKVRLRIKKIDLEVRVTIWKALDAAKIFSLCWFCYGKDQACLRRRRGWEVRLERGRLGGTRGIGALRFMGSRTPSFIRLALAFLGEVCGWTNTDHHVSCPQNQAVLYSLSQSLSLLQQRSWRKILPVVFASVSYFMHHCDSTFRPCLQHTCTAGLYILTKSCYYWSSDPILFLYSEVEKTPVAWN